MRPITLVSGAPGSGKTTLARSLAAADPMGLHLVSDVFYEFIAHPIDPSTPASHAQNETVMRALASAVAEFAQGGYAVFLDGVIGPWMLPLFGPAGAGLEPLRYVVLQASEDESLRRVRMRQGAGVSPVVRHMHRAFRDLGDLSSHAVDTDDREPAQLEAEVARLLGQGRFDVDWSRVPG